MLKYVEGSLTKHQFGFLPNRPTLQQLVTFTNEILHVKTEVDVVYIDFRKAFDSVSHNGLLMKLNSIGISLASYGHDSGSTCSNDSSISEMVIGDSMSALCKVLSGVPQGSVLGPLLFVIFINDLPEGIKFAIPFIFADNTKCLIAVKSTADTDKLQEDINNTAKWIQGRREEGFQRFQETPCKIWTFEFETGAQHTIQLGYSKQLIVMTQHNNLL